MEKKTAKDATKLFICTGTDCKSYPLTEIKNDSKKPDRACAPTSMNETMENRKLKNFLYKARKRLKIILDRLAWTEEDVFRNFNSNSRAVLHTGNEKNNMDPPFPASAVVSSKHTVIIGQDDLRKLMNDTSVEIPQRFSDLQLNFTREQKVIIYDHVIERTGKWSEPELKLPEFAEIVAVKNREKKKRRKYRISKPTHIEEVRGLVDLQMQALHQYLEAEGAKNANKKPFVRKERERDPPKSGSNQSYYKHKHSYDNHGSTKSHNRNRGIYGKRRHTRSRSRSMAKSVREKRSRSRQRARSKDLDRSYKNRKRRSSTLERYRKEKRSNRNKSRSRTASEKATSRSRSRLRNNVVQTRGRVSREKDTVESRTRIRKTEREEVRTNRQSRSQHIHIKKKRKEHKSRNRSPYRDHIKMKGRELRARSNSREIRASDIDKREKLSDHRRKRSYGDNTNRNTGRVSHNFGDETRRHHH